jgi:cell division protein FtsZ
MVKKKNIMKLTSKKRLAKSRKVLVVRKNKNKNKKVIKKIKKKYLNIKKKILTKKNIKIKKIVKKPINKLLNIISSQKSHVKAVVVRQIRKKEKDLNSKIKKIVKNKTHFAKYHKEIIFPKAKVFSKISKIEKSNPETSAFSAEEFFKAKIKVIGIGGGGGSIVSEIGRTLKKATFVVADTDIRSIKKRAGIKYFLFGQDVTHGLGTGANPEIAKQAALSEQDKIEGLFKDQDIVILIVSLGGGVGSGATEVFAKMASSFGAITLGIFTLPFKFEGKTKTKIALKALKELREMLNVSLTIPNENIFKIIDQNTPITQAFSMVNKNMVNSLESLIDLIYSPGMINIDFADLRAILRGKGSVAFLNTIQESGKNRAQQVAEKILINPIYKNNNFQVDKILFNISGPKDMSMFEVEKISNKISNVNSKSKIIFGISKNNDSNNKIKTTLLMTGSLNERELVKEIEESVKVNEILTKEAKEEKVLSQEKITEKLKEIKKENKTKNKKIKLSPSFVLPILKKEGELDTAGILDKKLNIVQIPDKPAKKAIRRSALDIKKAEAVEQDKRLAQEQEWEIPAFLRRVKFKS